jgi:hypothetical protein
LLLLTLTDPRALLLLLELLMGLRLLLLVGLDLSTLEADWDESAVAVDDTLSGARSRINEHVVDCDEFFRML